MEATLLLLIAGLLSGAMNALAGGGTFVSLPALMAVGLPSVSANATSTAALFPGMAASASVYRRQLHRVAKMPVPAMLALTLTGGTIGALLLLATPVRLFDRLLPWLLLFATIVLAFAPRIGPWMQARVGHRRLPLIVGQVMMGAYGGYYGGAVGLMMLALWSLIDGADIKTMTGTRILMVAAAGCIAIPFFAVAGLLRWAAAIPLSLGAVIGGYVGARLGQRLPPKLIRGLTLLLCAAVTTIFFVRSYA